MKVGICGTGRMGAAIAQRLIAVGHEVGVWNRDATKTKPLVDDGAKAYASPAALAEGCDTVVVMLLNDAATEAVYRGANGLLTAKLAGKLVIDMSTIRPDTMASVGSAVTQLGAAFVECPVGGSKVPAKEGKLFGLVGGTEADVARAKPLLEQLCRRIEHVGPLGSGATLKLAVTTVQGRYVCVAQTKVAKYYMFVDLQCRDLKIPRCVSIYNISQADGTMLYQRQR